jgi:arsenate reductase (thioredoxin)
VFSPETVRRYVEASYEEIGDRPTVGPNFLPVIIERFAREQLWAIAQATGAVEKPLPEVLFVCERNAGRSQMAACLAHILSRGWIAVRSAGSHPDEQIDPADVVVTLGCGDVCPVYPDKRYQDWPVADPAGQPLEVVRRIRYKLYHHVWELIETLVPGVELLDLQRPTGGNS